MARVALSRLASSALAALLLPMSLACSKADPGAAQGSSASAAPAGAAALVAIATYDASEDKVGTRISEALAQRNIQAIIVNSKGATVNVPAGSAEEARRIVKDLIAREGLHAAVYP
ncbi:MAG: hypothetical protein QM820_60610 [Minicystis sp.]